MSAIDTRSVAPAARGAGLPPELSTLVARASRRLFRAAVAERLGLTLLIATAALLAAMAVEKLTFLVLPWQVMIPSAIAAATLAALVWALVRLPRGVALAETVDRRTGLRETLSTAYVLRSAGDPWSRAIIDNAVERSRRAVLRDAIPVQPNQRHLAWSVAMAAALVVLAFVPKYDLTGVLAAADEEEAQRNAYEQTKAEIIAKEQKLEEILARTGLELEEQAPEQVEDQAIEGQPERAEDLRREAIKRLTNLADQLENVQQNDRAQQLQAMRQAMNQLKAPPPGPAENFQRQLARGNFGEAREQLEQLRQQIESGEMSDEQREQAARQLGQLAEQFDQLSQQRDQLEQAMQQAGMSAEQAEQAAKDPSELERLLQQMPGIPMETQQALRRMADAQQNAGEAMQAMAQAAQQMAEACENPGAGQGQQMSDAAGQMAGALSAAEMMAAEQAAAAQALAEAQAQLASHGESMCEGGACMSPGAGSGQNGTTGSWSAGMSLSQGAGSGGPGSGQGAGPDAIAQDFVLKREKANVRTEDGPIIGSTVVYGAQVRGESRAEFGAAAATAATEAAEAVETMQVPREYHDAVRAYFGRLESAADRPDQPDTP